MTVNAWTTKGGSKSQISIMFIYTLRNQWHLVDEFPGRKVVSPKIKPFEVSPIPRRQSEMNEQTVMRGRDNSTSDKDPDVTDSKRRGGFHMHRRNPT